MTPRLVLLTGPAAEEVAEVLRRDQYAPGDPVVNDTPLFDEVRDYEQAFRYLRPTHCETPFPREFPLKFARLPGGEEWLVGLVLPTPYPGINLTCSHTNVGRSLEIGCSTCRNYSNLPSRLAILAPDPPPLLVEKVRDWGGEMWHCKSYPDGWCYVVFEDGGSVRHMSWPEAVRAALGKAL